METKAENPFLNSALVVAAIFAVIMTAVSTIFSYSIINSEPSGSFFSPAMLISVVACLIALFAGMFAVRHHVKLHNQPIQMGRGAVIGVTTGVLVAVFSAILGQIWLFIDPEFNTKLMNAMIANFEAISEIPAATRDEMIDGIYTEFQRQETFGGILRATGINAVVFGGLNALTGLIGVKLFSPKSEQLDEL